MPPLDQYAAAFLGIFETHRLDRLPDVPITDLSLEDAYSVQQSVIGARLAKGESVLGYKVGCTSRAIRRQFGLSEPVCGRVMQPHVSYGDAVLSWRAFHKPAVEPEFVLTVGKSVTDEIGPEARLEDFVDFISPGIELHHYDWWCGEPTSQELICSNGLHAALVVGDAKLSPRNVDWQMEGVGLFRNGELADSGIGAEIMGGPMNSLRWLANHLVRRGESLRAGQIVIPGSAVKLIPVEPGDSVTARFTHLGSLRATFERGYQAISTDVASDV